jgi:hypothetical protein
MLTVDPIAASVHYNQVSDAAERWAAPASPSVLGVLAIAVVIMLTGFALEWLRGILVALWSMTRLLFRALGVAVLLLAALAVLIGMLVVSTLDH